MSDAEFKKLLLEIVSKCVVLKNKYVNETNLPVDWICVFSQSEENYHSLLECAKKWGHVVDDTPSGPIIRFDTELLTDSGTPKVLKIRIPDPTKPELGDVDFTTDYENFKKKYFGKEHFGLIVREKFEMIELKDKDADVICYFSSIQPSKLVK